MGLDLADPERTQMLKTVLAVGKATVQSARARTARPVRALEIGEVVAGRYDVTEQLSEGGMGVVFRARDRAEGADVALKVVRPDCRSSEDLVRFRHEFYLMATLRHPRFASVRQYAFTNDGSPCLVMEYVPGEDLSDVLPLPWQDAATVLYQVGTALAFLHSRRYIHHDIKPGNVRVARNKDGLEARLIDFGIMEPIGAADTEGWVGTPAYMPPEALFGSPTDHRLDLYGLGVMAFEMMTGRLPFDLDDPQAFLTQKQLDAPDVVAALAGVPESLSRLIADLMAPDVAARPHDASVMLRRLRLAGHLRVTPSSAEKVPPYLSPSTLVARDENIQTLLDAFRSTSTAARLVSIRARRGGGRTALLRELRLRLQMHGAVVVEVNADAVQGSLGVLKALVDPLTLLQGPRLQESLRRAAPELCRILPSLRSLMPDVAPAPQQLHPTDDRVRTLAALRDWIATLTEEHRVALLVDDAHLSDALSLDALRALVSDPRLTRLFVAVSCPKGTDEDAPIDRLVRTGPSVSLEPFGIEDTRALLTSMFGHTDPHPILLKSLTDAAEGNPAYLIEVIRRLVQDGVIRLEDERWQLPRALGSVPLPGSLAEATATVLSELDGVARKMLNAIVVSRRPIPLAVLETLVAASEDEIFAALDHLVAAGLVVGHEGVYRLPRSVGRDHLYDAIAAEDRKRLHAWVARWLEGSRSGQSADGAELAEHHLRAGNPGRARGLLERAATELYERNAMVDARRPLEQLEAMLVESGAEHESAPREDRALLLLTRQRLGRIGVAIDSRLASRCFMYERATALPSFKLLSGEGSSQPTLVRRLGRVGRLVLSEAVSSIRSDHDASEPIPERIRKYFIASTYHASSLTFEGAFDQAHAVAHTLGALAFGHRTQANGAYNVARALPLVHQGFVAEADAALCTAISLFEDVSLNRGIPKNDLDSGYGGLLFLATLLRSSRGRPEAREWLGRMKTFVEEHGHAISFLMPNLLLLEIDYHLHRGEIRMAQEVERRYLAHHAEVGQYNADTEAQILINLARAAIATRDVSTAEALVTELSRRKPKDFFILGWGACVSGELWASQRLHARARTELNRALSYATRPRCPAPKLELRTLNVLAEVALDEGALGEAQAHAERALRTAQAPSTRSEYETLWALRTLVAIALSNGHADVVRRLSEEMEQLARTTRNPLFDAVAQNACSEASRALGKVDEATGRAAHAERLFEALGFAPKTGSPPGNTPGGSRQRAPTTPSRSSNTPR